jgi:hypothetical protein
MNHHSMHLFSKRCNTNKLVFFWSRQWVDESLDVTSWWFIHFGCNAHLICFYFGTKKKIVLFIFSPWKQTKCLLAIMILWAPYMVFIIWDVIWYWNVSWCIFKIQFQHFMHDASLVTHNHLTSFSSHLQLKQKNWNTYMMSKFNANIKF